MTNHVPPVSAPSDGSGEPRICNCWNKSPTVPTCRGLYEHLDDCPAKGSRWPVGAAVPSFAEVLAKYPPEEQARIRATLDEQREDMRRFLSRSQSERHAAALKLMGNSIGGPITCGDCGTHCFGLGEDYEHDVGAACAHCRPEAFASYIIAIVNGRTDSDGTPAHACNAVAPDERTACGFPPRHAGLHEWQTVLAAPAVSGDSGIEAPTHTDLMISPEAIAAMDMPGVDEERHRYAVTRELLRIAERDDVPSAVRDVLRLNADIINAWLVAGDDREVVLNEANALLRARADSAEADTAKEAK